MALQHKLVASAVLIVLLAIWLQSSNAVPCKTRIIYKTVHVPVHVIKKVPIIKEVKVPVYVKEHKKHHVHHGHKEHHDNGIHHEGMHKMGHGGMHDEHGFGGF